MSRSLPTFHESSPQIQKVIGEILSAEDLTDPKFVASGNFKLTYRATADDDRRIALKILSPVNNPERLAREIEVMRQCRHSGICELFSDGRITIDNLTWVYLIEEFIEGGTLEDRVSRKLLSQQEAVGLVLNLSDALKYLADRGYVHRDIKPQNILFKDQTLKHPVLADFGIVRVLNAPGITMTFQQGGPGTPYYSSPEQLQNDIPLIDWRSDQFSLGVVVFQSHFGFHPFAGADQRHYHELTVETVRARNLLPLENQNLIIQNGLTPLIKMLQSWPVDRFRTPTDLISAWTEIQGG